MVSIRLYICLLLLTIVNLTFANTLTGKVKNTDHLSLYYISNFITEEKTVVAECEVDTNETYLLEFNSDIIRTYYIDLGSQRAQIVITPNQNLSLDLPDYVAPTKADYLNPYFEEETILVYDAYQKDINYDIMTIEWQVANQLERVLESQTPSYTAKTAIDSLRNTELNNNTPFTKDYLHYSEAVFYHIANPENAQATKQNYMRQASVNLQNTAFTKLFLSEYNHPFVAPDGLFLQTVSDAIINRQLPNNFIENIGNIHKIKNTTMSELVCVKGFYDAALYAPDYQRPIAQLLGQLENQIQDKNIKTLCHSTRMKMEQLMVENPVPYYELFTLEGKKVPTILKRHNVLLAFVNTNIVECQKQLRLLEKYKAIYKRQLKVVVIAVYQNKKELNRFLNRNKFKDIYFTLWQNNEQLLYDYNIKALPTYYLIDKEGKLIYPQLSSPEENMLEELEQALGSE